MEYINKILLNLTDKEKNILLEIKPNYKISLYDYITTILIKHVDEKGYIIINSNKILLENYINKIIYNNSSPIEKFLHKNGADIEKMNKYLQSKIYGNLYAKTNDIDYTLTYRNNIYNNKKIENICIKNIIGTLCEENNITFEEMLNTLYSNKDEYSKRNNKLLREGINENIEKIKNKTPIELIMINNNYYIKSDGNHRVYYLLLCYNLELSKCKTTEEINMINNKYTLPFIINKKSKNELLNMISYAMIKCNIEDLKVINQDNITGIIKLQLKENIYEINNDNELIQILNEYLIATKNSQLINTLEEIGFFEKYNLNSEEKINLQKSTNNKR